MDIKMFMKNIVLVLLKYNLFPQEKKFWHTMLFSSSSQKKPLL